MSDNDKVLDAIRHLENRMDARFNTLDARLNNLDLRLSNVENRLSNVENRVANMEHLLRKIERCVDHENVDMMEALPPRGTRKKPATV